LHGGGAAMGGGVYVGITDPGVNSPDSGILVGIVMILLLKFIN